MAIRSRILGGTVRVSPALGTGASLPCAIASVAGVIVSAVIAQRRDDGDSNLHYLDGLELFGEDAADLPDDLHPSGDGYVRMGERFYEKVFTGTGAFAV